MHRMLYSALDVCLILLVPVTLLLGWRDTRLLGDDDAVYPENRNGSLGAAER